MTQIYLPRKKGSTFMGGSKGVDPYMVLHWHLCEAGYFADEGRKKETKFFVKKKRFD